MVDPAPVAFPSVPQAPLLPPDIKKDKIVVFTGGSSMVFDQMYRVTDSAPAWITLVPVEESEQSKKCYPREKYIRVMHEVVVGTVDELTELYREQLMRVFNQLTYAPPAGQPQPVIPTLNEPSLRIHNDVLAKNGMSPGTKAYPALINISTLEYEAFVDRKHTKFNDPLPTQHPFDRDTLVRLVATWKERRTAESTADSKRSHRTASPSDDPVDVQELIDALLVLKKDSEALHAANVARAKAEETKSAAGECGVDVAK